MPALEKGAVQRSDQATQPPDTPQSSLPPLSPRPEPPRAQLRSSSDSPPARDPSAMAAGDYMSPSVRNLEESLSPPCHHPLPEATSSASPDAFSPSASGVPNRASQRAGSVARSVARSEVAPDIPDVPPLSLPFKVMEPPSNEPSPIRDHSITPNVDVAASYMLQWASDLAITLLARVDEQVDCMVEMGVHLASQWEEQFDLGSDDEQQHDDFSGRISSLSTNQRSAQRTSLSALTSRGPSQPSMRGRPRTAHFEELSVNYKRSLSSMNTSVQLPSRSPSVRLGGRTSDGGRSSAAETFLSALDAPHPDPLEETKRQHTPEGIQQIAPGLAARLRGRDFVKSARAISNTLSLPSPIRDQLMGHIEGVYIERIQHLEGEVASLKRERLTATQESAKWKGFATKHKQRVADLEKELIEAQDRANRFHLAHRSAAEAHITAQRRANRAENQLRAVVEEHEANMQQVSRTYEDAQRDAEEIVYLREETQSMRQRLAALRAMSYDEGNQEDAERGLSPYRRKDILNLHVALQDQNRELLESNKRLLLASEVRSRSGSRGGSVEIEQVTVCDSERSERSASSHINALVTAPQSDCGGYVVVDTSLPLLEDCEELMRVTLQGFSTYYCETLLGLRRDFMRSLILFELQRENSKSPDRPIERDPAVKELRRQQLADRATIASLSSDIAALSAALETANRAPKSSFSDGLVHDRPSERLVKDDDEVNRLRAVVTTLETKLMSSQRREEAVQQAVSSYQLRSPKGTDPDDVPSSVLLDALKGENERLVSVIKVLSKKDKSEKREKAPVEEIKPAKLPPSQPSTIADKRVVSSTVIPSSRSQSTGGLLGKSLEELAESDLHHDTHVVGEYSAHSLPEQLPNQNDLRDRRDADTTNRRDATLHGRDVVTDTLDFARSRLSVLEDALISHVASERRREAEMSTSRHQDVSDMSSLRGSHSRPRTPTPSSQRRQRVLSNLSPKSPKQSSPRSLYTSIPPKGAPIPPSSDLTPNRYGVLAAYTKWEPTPTPIRDPSTPRVATYFIPMGPIGSPGQRERIAKHREDFSPVAVEQSAIERGLRQEMERWHSVVMSSQDAASNSHPHHH